MVADEGEIRYLEFKVCRSDSLKPVTC
jgi:hypothetical protein